MASQKAIAIYSFCNLLLLKYAVLGYNIYTSLDIEDGAMIFDASNGQFGCQYQMKQDKSCVSSQLQFSIGKDNGQLIASHKFEDSELHDPSLCSIVITVLGCHHITKLEIPLSIHVLPPTVLLTDIRNTPMVVTPPFNISVHVSSKNHIDNTSLVRILPTDNLADILPTLLRDCDVRTHFINKNLKSDFKLKHGGIWGSQDSMVSYHSQVITMRQTISKCPVFDYQETIIPDQKADINLYISMEHMSARSKMSRKIPRRRKRSFGSSIRFVPKMKIAEIMENQRSDSEVVTLNLINPSKLSVTFTWHATTDKRSLGMFKLDSKTGVVRTTGVLDRESMSSHSFRVTARSSSGQSADCSLLIKVGDKNDNAPKFEKAEYCFNLREDELSRAYIGKVTASDNDDGVNQEIRYSIQGLQPSGVFAISTDGEITLNGRIDREKTAEYSFTVLATDKGGLPQRSQTRVVITIDDVNDNTPKFSQSQYHVQIGEDTKRNTNIKTVTAVDNDAGENGKITYSLMMSNDRNFFSIDKDTGEITVIADINFENHPTGFRLRVRAQDGGRPPKASTCVVVVTLVDVNDNTPTFLSSSYLAVVSEDLNIGAEVTQVKAVDSDAGENARISYSFVNPPPYIPFRINNTSGRIVLATLLDYEKQKMYRFTVQAMDHGQPRKSSTASVEVRVRNINDNAPKFTLPVYRVRVAENMQVGRVVIKVIAEDADEGSTLHYRIISGNTYNKFGIITQNNIGVISLAQSLDFNQKRSYVLMVMCSDGSRTSTAQVRINVTDANTHVPEFDKSSYEITVSEDVDIGTMIQQVHATDKDVGENAKITYALQAPSRAFSLNPTTGEIKTKTKLDYDTMSQLYLTVIAKDNGIPQHQTEALVTIYLQDINDNAPIFDQPEYSASVLENVKIGTSVTRIRATDRDSGKNGQIFYTFQGGDDGSGYFKIDQSSGVIRTAAGIDREHIAEYRLVAYATDRGSPPKQTPVTVVVTVKDVDDNPPQFPSDELTFEVREDSPVGSIVAKLEAIDPDEAGQSKVLYELAMGVDALTQWDLNYVTGELSPTFPLDYETKTNYTLIVSAYSNQLLSQVTVHINLIDVNDNPPVLNDFQIIFNNYRTRKPYTFPFGPIGKIPAYDPDVSSVLKYKFSSGNNNSLLILNETTGELRLSSKLDNDREFTATFDVEVSDGKYNVSGKCILKVVPITDEMLTNSVTVRVQQMSQEDFLSNAMTQFVHGLGQILNVSAQDVYIFNVQNDTDVTPHAVVNVSFSARHQAGYFFTTQHLQEQVYLNRSLLTNYSMQNVMPFDDNICLREPCENYMRCVSALYFNSSAPFVSTETVLFRPIHPVSGLRCKCPSGFAGIGCENEVNLCHSSKCKNGGKCISVEGGYVCKCDGNFAGKHCEVNLVGSQCSEARGICRNGAKCHPFPAGGFRCDCQVGGLTTNEMTPFCELRGRSFRKGDFAMFSGITRQWRFTLSLSFATRERNGLLLYNGRFNHQHDYLSLEIVEGQVQLNFSTGQHFTVVSPFIEGGVNDGHWHTVLIEYHNKPEREVLGPGHTGPSNIKVVTVTVDPERCDPAVSLKWHASLGNYTCSKTAEQGGTKSSLDLTTPLLIGGVPKLPEAYQVRSRYFVGCLRDIEIDHRRIDMYNYVANHGSQPGCSALRNHCQDNPCFKGSCENSWGTFKCNCPADHGGKRCERIQPVDRFNGVGCLKHQQVGVLPSPMSQPWKHYLSVRTTQTNGAVLHIKIAGDVEIKLSVQNQLVTYSVRLSRSNYKDQVEGFKINDGKWHEITVEWRKIDRNIKIDINIDDGTATDSFIISNLPSTLTSSRSRITELYLGGFWTGSKVTNSFIGCIRGLEFSARNSVQSVPSESLRKTAGARVSTGCNVGNPCQYAKCPLHSNCVQKFDTYECKCDIGYVGDSCTSTCILNPCHKQSKCIQNSSKPYGYECQCSSQLYYGRTCQLEHIQPCPKGWHGYPICKPCNCPVERNFDADCNNDQGVCKCKKNHYFSSRKNMCLPCNCYHVGSIGLNCTDEIGQCKCKTGVVGKQCNKCSSKFAEVTDIGCNILYNECPQVIEDGIMWRREKFGIITPARCPKDANGIATRFCTKEDGWLKPMMGNCTSLPYFDLKKDLQNLLGNPEYINEHSVRASLDAARRLHSASISTDKLYQGDVLMSYKMINKLLSMQKSLNGFDLTASRGTDFNDYLIEATSHSLATDNMQHWKSLQNDARHKNQGPELVNSALLLRSYEEYAATLTRNMKGIFYKSIASESQNVRLHIQLVSNEKEEHINIGSSSNSTGSGRFISVVLLPYDNEHDVSIPDMGTVGVIEFSTLGPVLPMQFHDSRLEMRIPQKAFINSAVVTIVTHSRVNQTSRSNKKIVEITFPLLRKDGSDPQCVFWNMTSRNGMGVGGWSQKGCTTYKENKTHVTCACSHLTSFAIVSDEEVVSVIDDLPVKIILYTSVVIILSCIMVCLGFSCCLEDVKTNHAKIHNNFAMSVFFSELCFVIGIMQTSNTYVCMAVAIFIHFFFMSTFAWVFVEGLHLYRMLKEKRDVNRGNMRVYYLFGWGIPAIITALSVGLDAKGFGNANFCWITTDHLLVWSFAGPLLFCAIVYILLFFMTLGQYFTSKLPDNKRVDTRMNLRASFVLLPVVAALWALALFAVNENKDVYYYLFSLTNILLGILILLLHCVFNKEIRNAFRNVKERRWQRAELNTTKQHLLKNSLSQTPDTSNGRGRGNIYISASSTSTTNTANRRNNHQDSSMFHNMGDSDHSDDSDSDLSNSSISLASTHSSDEDELEEKPTYLNVNNSSNWHHRNGHLPIRKSQQRGLVVHSTPKVSEKDLDNNIHPPAYNGGSASSKNDGYKSSLPTLSETNEEHPPPIEEPHYLAINSSRKDQGKEEKIEMIEMNSTDSLPKKGILKNGRRSKPPTPVRVDSLQRTHSPIENHEYGSDETSLITKTNTLDKLKVVRSSPLPNNQEQML
ncbi:cadherin EGF LAG seven-pass G-type receptor 2-like [Styela clava]